MLCVGRGGIGERRTPGPYPDLMEDRIGLDTVWAIGSCAFMADLFFYQFGLHDLTSTYGG